MKKIITSVFIIFFLASCNPSDLEKERDNTRINDLNTIRLDLEIIYSDTMEYPQSILDMNSLPIDPNEWELIHGCKMWYKYEVNPDINNIPNQVYRISTCFENKWNKETKALNDWGIYDNRYEIFSN